MKSEITQAKTNQRFESYLAKQPNGCWLWTGCQNDSGFGQFGVYDQKTGMTKIKIAHRYAYEQHIGRLLARNEQTTHTCGDKLCCNPEHIRFRVKEYQRIVLPLNIDQEKKEKQDCVLRMIDNLEENCINNGYTSEAGRMINHIRNYLVTHLFS